MQTSFTVSLAALVILLVLPSQAVDDCPRVCQYMPGICKGQSTYCALNTGKCHNIYWNPDSFLCYGSREDCGGKPALECEDANHVVYWWERRSQSEGGRNVLRARAAAAIQAYDRGWDKFWRANNLEASDDGSSCVLS